jgi:hypothetical protein
LPGIWFPQLPDSSLRMVGLEDRSLWNVEWDAFQSCLFGGVNGQKLPELTEIVFSTTEAENWGTSFSRLDLCTITEYTRINYIQFSYTFPVEGRGTRRAQAPDPYTLGSGAYYDQQCNDPTVVTRRSGRRSKTKATPDRRLGEHLIGVDAIYYRGLETMLSGIIVRIRKRVSHSILNYLTSHVDVYKLWTITRGPSWYLRYRERRGL